MENFGPLIFKGLGWGIVHSLWMGAVLYGFLMLLFQFLNWRARSKAFMLATALCMLLAFFCATVLYHLFNGAGAKEGAIAISDIDSVLFLSSNFNGSTPFKMQVEYFFPIIIVCYTLGVLFQLVVVVNSFRKLYTIRRRGLLDVPESWKAMLARKKQQIGLSIPIAFRFSTLVDVPAVVGHFKPVILFPMALFSGISMEQVEAVLIHELAHIKRRDYLINIVKTITETLLFFNPFVWLISRQLEVERENACDDVVVHLTAKPVHYARTLLWLEEHRQQPTHRLAMQAVNKKKHLLHRIQRMTNMRRTDFNIKHKLAVLTLVLGCIASIAWVNPLITETESAEAPMLPFAAISEDKGFLEDSTNNMFFQVVALDTFAVHDDTSTITFIGKDGVAHSFEGYEKLPDSLKAMVDGSPRHRPDSLRIIYSGPEWQKKMERMQLSKAERGKITERVHLHLDSLNKLFDSKEWKEGFGSIAQHIDIIRQQGDSIRAHFDSSVWREKLKAHADTLARFYNSPEGKKAREELKRKLEENKANFAEWRDMMIQQDRIAKQHMDSIKAHFDSPEWKSKMDQWKREGRDTTVVWPSMTIEGPKADVEQLLELQEQLQILRKQDLTASQLQRIETQMREYQQQHQLLEQHQKQYIDGSIKPWFNLRTDR